MTQHFGIPGIGGSLGQCGYCGENFLAEILLGQNTVSFEWNGIRLSAHKKCFAKYKDCDDIESLPEGPMKRAYREWELRQPKAGEHQYDTRTTK